MLLLLFQYNHYTLFYLKPFMPFFYHDSTAGCMILSHSTNVCVCKEDTYVHGGCTVFLFFSHSRPWRHTQCLPSS